MFIECILEIGEPKLINQLYKKYYEQLSKGEPCYLFDDKGYRIGRIYDISFKGTNKELKLIGKCEIWEKDSMWGRI